MRMRYKPYLQMMAPLRAISALMSAKSKRSSREVSPLLTFVALVLALLLAMLEVDLHRDHLQSLGLINGAYLVDPTFAGP